jgi:hypothetical protein
VNIGILKSLESLNLDFQMLKKVTEFAVSDMVIPFKNLTKLVNFRLTCIGLKVSEATKNKIKGSLKWVKNITIV